MHRSQHSSSTHRLWSVGFVLVAASLAACGGSIEVDKPAPPTNLSALQRAYDSPSAPVNQTTAREALEAYGAFGELIATAGLHDFLEDFLDDSTKTLGEDDETTEGGLRSRRQGVTFAGNGYAEVVRICDGWGGDTDPGSMDVTLTFSPGDQRAVEIDPVIWGRFHDCRYLAGESGARILLPEATRVALHHGGALSFDGGFSDGVVLLEVVGGFDIGEETVDSDVDFRFGVDNSEFQYRLETSQGDLVALGTVRNPRALRGSNGTFTCDEDGRCTNVDSGDSFSLQ